MNFTDYQTQIATMAVVPVTDSNFQIILPQMLNYAELRIQRDLDFLSTVVSNSNYSLTAGNQYLNIADGDFVTLQSISLSSTTPHVPLLPTTKEFLQFVYPTGTTLAQPIYFAMQGGDLATVGNTSIVVRVGPAPDQTYTLIITGTMRQPTLYQPSTPTNTTFISNYLPDLLIMASMIYISAYQRNFGRINDDPAMAQTYESQYQALLKSAIVEEARKKFQSGAWSSMSPAIVSTPTRG